MEIGQKLIRETNHNSFKIPLVSGEALCFTDRQEFDVNQMPGLFRHRRVKAVAVSGEGGFARYCGTPTNLQAELLRLCARIGYSPPRF